MQFWKLKKPQKYDRYEDMPSWLLVFFGTLALLISACCGYGIGKIWQPYSDIANRLPLDQWGFLGWLITAELVVVAAVMWFFGSVSLRCNKLLHDRWFK